nr:OsmC family protein [Oleiagrimonas sp. C23AA]
MQDYRFEVRFNDTSAASLVTDEPPPLGEGVGPNPSRLLAAAVANCLAASLLFATRKFHDDPGMLDAQVEVELSRNEQRRWRITHIDVHLAMEQEASQMAHLQKALAQFEDFCVVTQSVRQGIAIDVHVNDAKGAVLR